MARAAVASVEETIAKMISERGIEGKLFLDFDGLHYFGSP